MPFASRCFVLLAIAATILAQRPTRAEERTISFNRDVRPILSDLCFQCHGPDEQRRQGNLRLDLAGAALKGGDSGPAIVVGHPETSELVARITSTDPTVQMPPPKSNKSLKPAQIETLKKWISEGAEYQGHWAFIKPERPPVPAIVGVTHPVDAFLRERLPTVGLTASPPAARETLLRRVTLDLTGLPPTLTEIDAFLADPSPQAYEKAVDRLLSSPHYGERMALPWLDFARYADSNGFQVDSSRQMWLWRDWVIRAYQQNLPFDQFTIEQLAGDMLPNATRDQIVATGFHRNPRLNGEGGRIAEEWFIETVIDRVETTGLTWMGLTFNCCRCHDHKYDPITQKEFYGLFAFFNSNDESGVLDSEGGNRGGGNSRPILKLPTESQQAEWDRLKRTIADADQRLKEVRAMAAQRQAVWEPSFLKEIAADAVTWRPLEPASVQSAGRAILTRQEDGTWLASGTNPPNDVYTITGTLAAGSFSGIMLEAFPDPSLPEQSLGRYPNGNFVLTDVDAEITAPSLEKPLTASITRAESDYDQPGWPVKSIIDDKPKRPRGAKNNKGWAVDGPTKKEPRKAIFVFAAPLTVPENATVTITLRHDAIGGHNIGRFRLSTSSLPPSLIKLEGNAVSPSLRAALATETSQRSQPQFEEIAKFFREQGDTALKQAEAEQTAAKKVEDDFAENLPSVMVMQERPQPRDAFVLKRGEYDKPGDKVDRTIPAFLPPFPADAPRNRLGLARWLVSRDHPLTARVWANRAWERFFGAGLVRTTENLGSQSDWPTHPELLDWLAVEFMEPTVLPTVNGQPARRWDMKAFQKFLVMSATYQQSSAINPTHLQHDPENRLLARGPRLRLGAETVRDQALFIGGLLVPTVGGPSVRPYMPEGVWDETSRYGDLRGYKADGGDGLYRRSLYTIWKRTAAPPSMLLFDAPSREICTVKRSRTNTPLQALALMNEVTYVEAGRKLAERMLTEGGTSPAERIQYGFRLTTGRSASTTERDVLVAGVVADLKQFQTHPEEAQKLITVGTSKPAPQLNPAELAAYTLTANVLMNLDEVVTRE